LISRTELSVPPATFTLIGTAGLTPVFPDRLVVIAAAAAAVWVGVLGAALVVGAVLVVGPLLLVFATGLPELPESGAPVHAARAMTDVAAATAMNATRARR
jgi:hypothetical protein